MKKAYKGMGMEGPIATWYARNTGKNRARFHETAALVRKRLPHGGSVLEVAPGPGYTAIELARDERFGVTGVDISHSFVRIARENARNAGVAIDFRHGDAAHLPFGDEYFDQLICSAAFKNFSDPAGAIDEMYRVLK